MRFSVYEHRRTTDGLVFYVGKGKGRRAWSHNGRNSHWHRTVAKHGHTVEIVATGLTEPEAFRIEQELLAHHRYHQGHERYHDARSADCVLTNMTDGGEGASGYVPSQDERDRIANALRGRKRPQEVCDKVSAALRNPSAETRAKISAANHSRVATAETRAKMSAAHTGFRHSEESKRRMSEIHRGRGLGRKLTDEHRKKIAAGQPRGEANSSYNPELLRFEIVATGERLEMTRYEARRQFELSTADLSGLRSGRQKTAKGLRLSNEGTSL